MNCHLTGKFLHRYWTILLTSINHFRTRQGHCAASLLNGAWPPQISGDEQIVNNIADFCTATRFTVDDLFWLHSAMIEQFCGCKMFK